MTAASCPDRLQAAQSAWSAARTSSAGSGRRAARCVDADAVDRALEGGGRRVARGHREAAVPAEAQPRPAVLDGQRQHALHRRLVDLGAVDGQDHAAQPSALAHRVGDGELVAAHRQGRSHHQLERVGGPGEGEVDPALDQVEGVAPEPVAEGEDDAARTLAVGIDVGGDVEAAPQQRDRLVGDRPAAGTEGPRRPGGPDRGDEAAEAVDEAVGNGQHVVAVAPRHPTGRACAAPVRARRRRGRSTRRSRPRGRRAPSGPRRSPAADGQLLLVEDAGADVVGRGLPSLVVDGARAHHLEVLGLVQLGAWPGRPAWRGG